MDKQICIGIKLGNTNSYMAFCWNDRVEIIANDQGNRTTPSYVAFTEYDRLIGEAALNQVARNPENTVFDTKRLIGRKFNDPIVQEDIKLWPFKVISGVGDKPQIVVRYKGQEKKFYAEQISSMILEKMKKTAEAYLGKLVDKALITVPAYFNDSQRQATKDAGAIAGLNVLRIINEPTAAAIAYGLDKKTRDEINVLIFQFGGSILDVSLLTIEEGIFEVKAIAGNIRLGGGDFDNRLVQYCAVDFQRKTGLDMRSNKRAIRRLRTQCERAKRILSTATSASIEVDSLYEGEDYATTITRARFEELCMELFRSTIDPVERVLKDAQISKSQVSEVVLVGGSTRMLKVQQLIQDFFNGKEPCKTINPDEVVAYGAAVQGEILSRPIDCHQFCIFDLTYLSLGIKTASGLMDVIIQRNTTIPIRKSKFYTTDVDNQQSALIQVFEGERQLAEDNNLVVQFYLNDIQPAPKGVPIIEIIFDVDANFISKAKAVDKTSGKESQVTLLNNKGRLSRYELQRMIKEAEDYKTQDQNLKQEIEAKTKLKQYIQSVQDFLKQEEIIAKIDQIEYKEFYSQLEVQKQQIEQSQQLQEDYLSQVKEIEASINNLILRSHKINNQMLKEQNDQEFVQTMLEEYRKYIKQSQEQKLLSISP